MSPWHCHVYLQLLLKLCVFVYLHVRHLGSLFSRSVYHYLSENIWFVWSKIFQNEEKLRCHACDGMTDTHIGFAVFC